MNTPAGRFTSIDAYRGLVMLLLLPDGRGAFSFYAMAERFPDSPTWTTLGRLFTHVKWSGFTFWDLIMPSFVFLFGVAMPLSVAARRARGDSQAQIVGHLLIRVGVLIVLSLVVRISPQTYVHEFWPLALLAAGLSVSPWLVRRLAIDERRARNLDLAWSGAILAASLVWLAAHIYEIGNYSLVTIFPQLALASAFAFLLIGKPRKVQFAAAFAILAVYWLLFALYPLPAGDFDRARVGVMPGDEIFSGFFAHWNKNANPGAAFDVWFFNLLPRGVPFIYDRYGLTTLNFVPTIASMIFGIMVGEWLRSGAPSATIRNRLLAAGTAGLIAGALASIWLSPLVKSLWTPSWVLFTSGLCTVVLALFYHVCDVRGWRAWALPLIVIGTNSILLYTICDNYRWRLLSIPQRLFGADVFDGTYGPLWESLTVLALLGGLALVLYRLRIFVRI